MWCPIADARLHTIRRYTTLSPRPRLSGVGFRPELVAELTRKSGKTMLEEHLLLHGKQTGMTPVHLANIVLAFEAVKEPCPWNLQGGNALTVGNVLQLHGDEFLSIARPAWRGPPSAAGRATAVSDASRRVGVG